MANVVITLFKPLGDHLCLADRDVDILEGIVPIKKRDALRDKGNCWELKDHEHKVCLVYERSLLPVSVKQFIRF